MVSCINHQALLVLQLQHTDLVWRNPTGGTTVDVDTVSGVNPYIYMADSHENRTIG